MKYKLFNKECISAMEKFPSGKVDLILTDPPYGTTECKWDTVIPLEPMWEQLHRIIKPNGAIILFGAEPFSSNLRISNIKNYKYDWIWEKSRASHFAQAPYRPLTITENIICFSSGGCAKNANIRMKYNPQGLIDCDRVCKGKGHNHHRPGRKKQADYKQTKTGYPKQIIKIASEGKNIHPTQKPVALMEYLIKTYSNEGELVLDFTMGSGTTGVACVNTDRDFIGIELDEKYFNIAKDRIEKQIEQVNNEAILTWNKINRKG